MESFTVLVRGNGEVRSRICSLLGSEGYQVLERESMFEKMLYLIFFPSSLLSGDIWAFKNVFFFVLGPDHSTYVVAALISGADRYAPLSISQKELAARIRALLRRRYISARASS
jgi:hypothetical protein